MAAPGSDGIAAYGGILFETGERNRRLVGSTRWVTYDNLIANVPIIAAAIGIWLDLAGASKWTAVPNPLGGADGVAAADLVQHGLLNARLPTKWRSVVKCQAVKRFRGFAMHAKGWRRAPNGQIVLGDLAHRPQWQIDRWIKPVETEPWSAVVQRTQTGAEFTIDRADLFYSHEGALGPDPRGVGILRHAVEVADIFARYRQLQGIAFDTDANGIPLPRAPLAKLAEQARETEAYQNAVTDEDRASVIRQYVLTATGEIRRFASERVVTPNRSLLLESRPYSATNMQTGQETISSIFEWSVDTLRQAIGCIPDLGKALSELVFAMARLFSAEFMLMGGAGSSGAFAASNDKTSLFATRVNATLDDIGDDGERDIVPDLCARNGYTDERTWPSLQHEPVSRTSLAAAATMLREIHAAALKPGDPAENVMRARADLPPAPEPDDEDLAAWRSGRAGGGGAPGTSAPAAEEQPPTPSDEEQGAAP